MLARGRDLPFLVILSGVAGVAMLLPAIHAVAVDDDKTARAFFYASIVVLMMVGLVAIATSRFRTVPAARNELAALVGAYVLLPLICALPFSQAVPDTSFANAWFEMVSCFTTTGATLYDAAGRLPASVHFWRALVGWMGGFFILLAALAILAPLNLGGGEVLVDRAPGRGARGVGQVTRTADAPARLWGHSLALGPAYLALTLILWIGLLMAGNAPLMALGLAMGALSTSGIVPVEGGMVPAGVTQLLVFAGMATALTRRAMPGRALVGPDIAIWRDPELRLAVFLLLLVPAVLVLRQVGLGAPAGLATLWGAMFTTLSFLTTTGYATPSLNHGTPGLVLLGLCVIGGGVATTAGGVKLLRVYALFRHGERELERLIHPHSIGHGGAFARRLRREGAYMAWIFFMIFAITIACVMLALTATGVAFEPAMVLAVAALSTTGPLAGVATENPILYAILSDPAKAILGVTMVVGRLETLAILALLAPAGWRR